MEVARERHSHGFLRLTARPPLPNSLVRAVDKSVILEVQAILQVVQFVYEPEKKVDDPDEEAETFIRSLLAIQVSANLFMIVGRDRLFGQVVSCAAIRY